VDKKNRRPYNLTTVAPLPPKESDDLQMEKKKVLKDTEFRKQLQMAAKKSFFKSTATLFGTLKVYIKAKGDIMLIDKNGLNNDFSGDFEDESEDDPFKEDDGPKKKKKDEEDDDLLEEGLTWWFM